MIYGCESWALLSYLEKMLERAEMRMLRWMCGVRLSERKSNEGIRKALGLEGLTTILRLRWFGDVKRKGEEDWVNKAISVEVEGRRHEN